MKRFFCAPPKASLFVHTQLEESRQRQGAAQLEADIMETQVLEQLLGPSEGPGQGGRPSAHRPVCGALGALAGPVGERLAAQQHGARAGVAGWWRVQKLCSSQGCGRWGWAVALLPGRASVRPDMEHLPCPRLPRSWWGGEGGTTLRAWVTPHLASVFPVLPA